MHALGGGRLGSGGSFPTAEPAGCKAQLSTYIASGEYLSEVRAAIDTAYEAIGLPTKASGTGAAAGGVKGSRDQLVVFDIDETALSNIVTLGGGAGGAAPAVAGPTAGFVRRGGVAEWDRWVAANKESPPLEATLGLYKALCMAGFSVAFVTGRSEEVRVPTAYNLLTAGYGRHCANVTNAATAAAAPGDRGEECCYVDLMLRPPGDDRLASVYKPWARRQLELKGYKLFGSVGDQFSDLNGEHEAPYSFKLPNTFYYIL